MQPPVEPEEPVYFCSHKKEKYPPTKKWRRIFSQWYPQNFVGKESIHDLAEIIDPTDVEKYIKNNIFSTREKWMMICKCLIFAKGVNRAKNIELLETKLIIENNPATIKKLGRKIQGFDEQIWQQYREQVVENGNYLQFSQNEQMRKILLDTQNREIVEAANYDAIWGIGFSENDAEANRSKWGLNLLGKALMKVRSRLAVEATVV